MLDRQADEIWKGMDEETRSAYGEEAFRKAYEALKDHGVSSPNFFNLWIKWWESWLMV